MGGGCGVVGSLGGGGEVEAGSVEVDDLVVEGGGECEPDEVRHQQHRAHHRHPTEQRDAHQHLRRHPPRLPRQSPQLQSEYRRFHPPPSASDSTQRHLRKEEEEELLASRPHIVPVPQR